MKIYLMLVVAVMLPLQVMGREVKTTIGEWGNYAGLIRFSVEENNGKKKGIIWVCDDHVVNTNFFYVTKNDLLKLKALIDETLEEL